MYLLISIIVTVAVLSAITLGGIMIYITTFGVSEKLHRIGDIVCNIGLCGSMLLAIILLINMWINFSQG